MYTLRNDHLSVLILDPVADRERLGSRYVTGGYIYQVTDARAGELFSGPHYPHPVPDVIDGQGAPDMFFTPLIAPNTPVGGEVGCIGVGRVRRSSEAEPFNVFQNRLVLEWLPWDIKTDASSLLAVTSQQFLDWGYELTRLVELRDRTITSRTSIRSTGDHILPVRWFAHPFWPHTPDNVLSLFSPQVGMQDNPGFKLNDAGWICRREDFDWEKQGHYQPLQILRQEPLEVIEKHPLCGETMTRTNFAPGFLPIWANKRTYSFEPYFIRELNRGEEAAWQIEYSF